MSTENVRRIQTHRYMRSSTSFTEHPCSKTPIYAESRHRYTRSQNPTSTFRTILYCSAYIGVIFHSLRESFFFFRFFFRPQTPNICLPSESKEFVGTTHSFSQKRIFKFILHFILLPFITGKNSKNKRFSFVCFPILYFSVSMQSHKKLDYFRIS